MATSVEKATASAYVKGGRLCIIGVAQTSMGPVPFSYHADMGEEIPDGPVDLGDEKMTAALDASREPIAQMVKRSEIALAAKSLVERSRTGDQNAMALIREISVRHQRGSRQARAAFQALSRYIERNPVGKPRSIASPIVRKLGVAIGEDSEHHYSSSICVLTPNVEDPYVAATVIANGPELTAERVKAIESRFTGDEEAFRIGWSMKNPRPAIDKTPHLRDALSTGSVVHMAFILQGVRSGKLPVSKLCPMAGWELGE